MSGDERSVNRSAGGDAGARKGGGGGREGKAASRQGGDRPHGADGAAGDDGRPPRAWFGRVEIPSPDPGRAAAFYHRVFGWEAREVESGDGEPYLSLHPAPRGGGQTAPPPAGGGLTTARALGSASPLAVIHVEGMDLEAVLERIQAAGGRVDLPPTAIGDHGTFARFADPDGHLLGLWQSSR